jgi:hypothetical protein
MPDGLDGPAAVFQQAADALDREDFLAVARLCDPASLSLFRRRLLRDLAPSDDLPPLTVELYLRHHPDMPCEVAEYNVANHHRRWAESRRVDREVARTESYDALEALAPDEAYARWLEAHSVRAALRRQLEARGISGEQMERALDEIARPDLLLRPIGAVEHGRTAYVVYLVEPRTESASTGDHEAYIASLTEDEREIEEAHLRGPVRITSVRRQPDGTWRLIARQELLDRGHVAFEIRSGERSRTDSGGESAPAT